jgi:FlaA1/EpsC-like NDP-sugar epimerase
MFRILKRPNFWIVFFVDAVLAGLAYFLAYYLRFDGDIPAGVFANWTKTVVWIVPLKLVCCFFFGIYKGMWRYTGIYDLENLIKACVISSGIIVFILVLKVRFVGFSRSVFAIDLVLTFLFLSGVRVGLRLFLTPGHGSFKFPFFAKVDRRGVRVLVVGAGSAGEKLLREIKENPGIQYQVAGCIDDDKRKLKQTIHGVPVLGRVDEIKEILKKEGVDEIIIAISAASAMEMRRIVAACEETGLPCKTLPGVGELIEGKVSVQTIRKIRYEDLLGRKQVQLNLMQIGRYLTDKRVMVTGGTGSIGSELCRQIIRFTPKKLIIVDINESGLYDMEMDFKSKLPNTEIVPVLCPIQDMHVMSRIFEQENPEVVFHAAAYKHVPMMELHPWEAVLNNIVGTQSILELCARMDVRRCVVVSTDKAVRPTNVMGASKRMGELLAQAYATELGARNMCVRFGNVVYSAGSVVPLFRKQIERGGPVTLTHKDVMRYFMTISEASRLILQAGAIGNGGEIFILKMGTPIRIADMARDLIRLSGFEPDTEIEIKEIGLRPGEKLVEELITEGEGVQETEHSEIMVLKAESSKVKGWRAEDRGRMTEGCGRRTEGGGQVGNGLTLKVLRKHIKRLVNYAEAGDGVKIREELKRIVPEYRPEG